MTDLEDRNFLKTLYLVIASLTAFFVLCIVAARMVSASGEVIAANSMSDAATIERIKPFGKVNVGKVPVAASSGAVDGKATYMSACFACHGTGAAGAPKLGDKGAWRKRIAQGNKTLLDHAINGFNAMPAKGGNISLSDEVVKAAVEYMVKGSK